MAFGGRSRWPIALTALTALPAARVAQAVIGPGILTWCCTHDRAVAVAGQCFVAYPAARGSHSLWKLHTSLGAAVPSRPSDRCGGDPTDRMRHSLLSPRRIVKNGTVETIALEIFGCRTLTLLATR